MVKNKRSFFERLTGAVSVDERDDDSIELGESRELADKQKELIEEETTEGQLSVDVHQTPEEIIIRSMVAGVKPEDLDIAITRDMVTIKGRRGEEHEVSDENYFYRELYWGTFSRTILLPQEIEVEEAEATEKNGLLTIRLPKVDKEKQTKLKVKSNS